MAVAYPRINFWENFVPLHRGFDGPQLAGWPPGLPVKSNLGCVLYADQMEFIARFNAPATILESLRRPSAGALPRLQISFAAASVFLVAFAPFAG